MQGMIRAESVGKEFTVYPRPRDWLVQKLFKAGRKRDVRALSDVSFSVGPGQCLGVVGANGAGKSTLLRVLAGISQASAGHVEVSGRVSAVLELDSGFHPEFTGRENVRMGSAVLGLSPEEARASEDRVIEFSGLGEFIDLPVRTYSTGMYLRLGFSLATAVDPEVLLVDEALAVGDEWFSGRCVERIKQIKDAGAAVAIASHDLTLVRALCDNALLLERGEVLALGKPMEVINSYLDSIYRAAALPQPCSPRQAAAPGESAIPSDVPRRGSGEIEITAARMTGPKGEPATVFKTGEPLSIEFDYLAHQAVDSPLFGVNVFRSDGVLAVCTNSEASRYTNLKHFPGRDPGDHPQRIEKGAKGTAGFRVEMNPLLPGSYELSVNVYKGRSGAHAVVDELLGLIRFRVLSGDHADRGLLLCPGRWEIKG